MSWYTAVEIFGWLIVAAGLGFFVGWLVSVARRDAQAALEAEFLTAKMETEAAKVEALEAKLESASGAARLGPGVPSVDLQAKLDALLVDREAAAGEAMEARKALAERDAEVVGLRARLRAVEGRLQSAEDEAQRAIQLRDESQEALVAHAQKVAGAAGDLSAEREALHAATKSTEKAALDLAQAQLQTRALRDELEVHVSRLDGLAGQLAEQTAVPASALLKDDGIGLIARCRADAVEAKLVQLLAATERPSVDPSPYAAPALAPAVSPYAAPVAPEIEPEPAPAEPAPAPEPEAPAVNVDDLSTEEIQAHVRGIGERTAAGLPVHDDDLKRVNGIGKKIEKLLKGLGITSFAQVARFEPDDVAYIGRALETFPDRITRDEWMRKARALHQEDYDEDPLG